MSEAPISARIVVSTGSSSGLSGGGGSSLATKNLFERLIKSTKDGFDFNRMGFIGLGKVMSAGFLQLVAAIYTSSGKEGVAKIIGEMLGFGAGAGATAGGAAALTVAGGVLGGAAIGAGILGATFAVGEGLAGGVGDPNSSDYLPPTTSEEDAEEINELIGVTKEEVQAQNEGINKGTETIHTTNEDLNQIGKKTEVMLEINEEIKKKVEEQFRLQEKLNEALRARIKALGGYSDDNSFSSYEEFKAHVDAITSNSIIGIDLGNDLNMINNMLIGSGLGGI